MKQYIKKVIAMVIVGLSAQWLCFGGGIWFLVPWTIGWLLYNDSN